MKLIKIDPEFGAYPLWARFEDDIFDYVDPSSIGLSQATINELNRWNQKYQNTLADYPPDSKFSSKDDEVEFEREGFKIWEKIQNELGNEFKVIYYSVIDQKMYDDDRFRGDNVPD